MLHDAWALISSIIFNKQSSILQTCFISYLFNDITSCVFVHSKWKRFLNCLIVISKKNLEAIQTMILSQPLSTHEHPCTRTCTNHCWWHLRSSEALCLAVNEKTWLGTSHIEQKQIAHNHNVMYIMQLKY